MKRIILSSLVIFMSQIYFTDVIFSADNDNSILSFIPAILSGVHSEPDLIVESPRVSDSTLKPSQSFKAYATVKNQGSLSSGTTLRYYRSTNSTISREDTQISTDSVPALSFNDTSPQSATLTAPNSTGTYWIGACVDSVSGESNTGNNCSKGVRIEVASPSPNLLFEDQFDTFPNPSWHTVGVINQDYNHGLPSPPSLSITSSGDIVVESMPSWPSDEGLDIYISIRADNDNNCIPVDIPEVPIQVGTVLRFNDIIHGMQASLTIYRGWNCETVINYWFERINRTEVFNKGLANGQFWNFNLRVFPNGDAQWLRDGYLKVLNSSRYPIENSYFYLLFKGAETVELNYDNFKVYKMP